jgi:ferredoxin
MPHRFEVVEDDCTGCGLCSERAPGNLEIPAGSSIAEVFKQPETAAEEQACLEASEYCPTGGLLAHAKDLAPADSSERGRPASFVPAGEPTPAGIGSNDWRNDT